MSLSRVTLDDVPRGNLPLSLNLGFPPFRTRICPRGKRKGKKGTFESGVDLKIQLDSIKAKYWGCNWPGGRGSRRAVHPRKTDCGTPTPMLPARQEPRPPDPYATPKLSVEVALVPASCHHAEKLDLVEKIPRSLEPRLGRCGDACRCRDHDHRHDQLVPQEL